MNDLTLAKAAALKKVAIKNALRAQLVVSNKQYKGLSIN